MKSRIIVCGRLETEKTELLKTVISAEGIPTVHAYSVGTVYDTPAITFFDCSALPEYGKDFFAQLNAVIPLGLAPDQQDNADILWYCLDSNNRQNELEFLADFQGKCLIVLTGCDSLEPQQLEHIITLLEKVGIDSKRVVTVSITGKSGLNTLLTRTLKLLGKRPDELFPAVHAEWEKMQSEVAASYIKWAAGRAFGIALVPLPLADVAPLTANEAYMFYKLGSLYGYAVDKTALAGFLGCLGASLSGTLLASFAPILKASIAAAVTYGVGCAAQAYFESGMSMKEQDLKDVFLRAKEKAEKMKWN